MSAEAFRKRSPRRSGGISGAKEAAARHRDRLSEEDRAAVDVMLRFSDRLLQAYALKEAFYDFMAVPNRDDEAERLMDSG